MKRPNPSPQSVRDGKVVHHITQRRRRDDAILDVELFGVPVVVMGKQIGILGLYHDITELSRRARKLKTPTGQERLPGEYEP